MDEGVSHNFIFSCYRAIETMRQAGLNDTLIACVLSEVRAAAIFEERQRLEILLRANPPHHPPHGVIAKQIEDTGHGG